MARGIWIAVLSLLIGAGLGYWLVPTKVVEKLKIVEKIVEKRDVVTVVVEKPDGTKTTTTTDKTTVDSGKTTDKFKSVEKDNLNWIVSASYLRGLDSKSEILGSVHRRLFGEIYVGIVGSSNRMVGVGVSLRF